jgi:hypothetical protein
MCDVDLLRDINIFRKTEEFLAPGLLFNIISSKDYVLK